MARTAEHDLSASPLARSAASGVRWTSLAAAVVAVLNLLQTFVVARLLNPADFGLMAAATVVLALAGAFADAGLASAIVARKTTREALSSLYWVNLLMGATICCLVIAVAPLVSDFYHQPRLEGIVRVSSLVFLFAAIGQQFGWLLEKNLRFRPLGIVQIGSSAVGTAVTITAAALGAGVYALILGVLVTVLIGSLSLTALGWRDSRPALHLRWADVRGYLDFGLYQMGERSVNYLAGNTDYILIGRFLGPTALGTYSVAYQLVIKPTIYINPMLNRVAFPVLALRQDDDPALRRGYLHVVRLVAYMTLPLMIGLAVLSSDFVSVVLGPKWEASAPVVAILCGVGALRSLANPIGSVLLAKNRPDVGFKGNVVAFAVMAAALVVAVQSGIMAVAWVSLAVTLLVYVAWLLVLRRIIGLRLGEYGRTLWRPLAFSIVMAAAVAMLQAALGNVRPAIGLLAGVVLGALVYAGLLARFDTAYLHSLWRLFRSRAPSAQTEQVVP